VLKREVVMLTKEQERELQEWCESAAYLPEFIRDFHDQKDLFKTIHWLCKPKKLSGTDTSFDSLQAVSWIQGQIYVIDKFLWVMAKFGYTLQRSRKRGLVYRDYVEFNRVREAEEHASFKQFLEAEKEKAG
jgi:hypothetical protein